MLSQVWSKRDMDMFSPALGVCMTNLRGTGAGLMDAGECLAGMRPRLASVPGATGTREGGRG